MAEKVRHQREALEPLVRDLAQWATEEVGSGHYAFGGSWRRGTPTVGDIDVVLFRPSLRGVEMPAEFSAERRGHLIAQGDYRGVHLDVWACPPESAGPFLWFITGPRQLNIWMRSRALSRGMRLTQTALEGSPTPVPTEQTVARALGMPFIPAAERDQWRRHVGAGGGVQITGDSGSRYELRRVGGSVTCTCPAYTFRGSCKHAADPAAYTEEFR